MNSSDGSVALQGHDSITINLGIVVGAWFAYVVFAPLLWRQSPWLALFSIVTIGSYLYTWLVYYRHELWHNYFPSIDNGKPLDLISHAMFSISKAYRFSHGSHHKYVHTDRDMEFFCEDYATDRSHRRRQFVLELLFGNIAWECSTVLRLARAGKISVRDRVTGPIASCMFLGCAALVAHWIQPGTGWYVFPIFVLTAWVGAVATRQSQWVEHLGILENDLPLQERDMLSRNLSSATVLGRLFNFYTHNDAREHILHHTDPRWNSRGLNGLSLPPGSQTTTIAEHWRRLWTFYQSL